MNTVYLKLRWKRLHLKSKKFRTPNLETGFSMLEAVVVVGVLLALAVSGFFAYGPIAENAKIAKVKSTAAEVYTAAQAANADGDPQTSPQKVIDTYNASTDKIRVEILPSGGVAAVGAMTTAAASDTYEPTPGEDFCVAARYVSDLKIRAGFGSCPADLGDGSTASPSPTPTPSDTATSEPTSTPSPSASSIPTVGPIGLGEPGDQSHVPSAYSTDGYLVLKFDTSVEAQCSTINLPIKYAGYEVTVNWGDNKIDKGYGLQTQVIQHTYDVQGVRYIVIKGLINGFGAENWEDAPCLLSVPVITDGTSIKDLSYAFNNTTRLEDINRFPVSITSLNGTFKNSTYNKPLSNNNNLPNLVSTYEMFKNNTKFNQQVVFIPKAIKNAASMFEGATAMNSYVSIGGEDRGQSLGSVSKMFKDATSFNSRVYIGYGDLITTAESMFENAVSFNQPIDMTLGFTNNATRMFKNAKSFNQSIYSLKFSYAANYTEMFMGATSFNQSVSLLTMKKGESHILQSMFEGATSFNQPLYNWDISNVRVVSRMFWNTPSYKQDLSKMGIYWGLAGTSTDFSDSSDRSWWPAGLAKA